MHPLPIGIVGVGHLGSLHAKMLVEIPAARFVGVLDVNGERAGEVAAQYGTTAFSDLDELLVQVQALCIATTTSTHFEIASRALARGVHVFIEKPITGTVEDACRLITLAKETGTKIQVGHIERFNPALLALEKYSMAPMFIESHRLSQFNPRGTDVAVVLDLMIHDIDIIMSLVPSPIVGIQANGVAVVSDTIDIANARLQFANGCVANVTASRISQKKMRKMRMFQRDTYISVDFSDGVTEVYRLIGADDTSFQNGMMLGEVSLGTRKKRIVYEQPEMREVNALKYELELFIDAVQHGKTPPVTAEEGMRALEVAQQIIDTIHRQPQPQ